MASNLHTSQFTITILFFISAICLSYAANNARYTICSTTSFSCGKIQNVGYPFWGGNRPLFCGNQNFELKCQNTSTDPLINYMGTDGSYLLSGKVINIDTALHRMSVVERPFSNANNVSCQKLIKNETMISLSNPFRFSPLVTNISLFFDCDNSIEKYRRHYQSFSCSSESNGSEDEAAYYVADDVSRISGLCQMRRVFPVMKSELEEMRKGNGSILEVLSKGFEVEYMVDFKGCLECQNSGGLCGSSESVKSTFVCYCLNGEYPLACPKSANLRRTIIIASGSLALVILVVVALIIITKGLFVDKFRTLEIRSIRENQNVEAFLKSYGSLAPKRYKYTDIKKITNSFREKLGEGGFGSVYKGKLHDGRFVAVKLLNKMKGNGEDFINEVLSISRTNHVNVVTLLGFCFEGNKRSLIYEYLVNGSLDKFIYGAQTRPSLEWETLLKIAVGIARGLDYLHRGCNTPILHFDVKPHNVLLDEEFCPKISDFGLAKLCPTKDSSISMLEARGTIGYIAPEVFYRNFGGVSHKSDVYSYGMMVLDMACQRANLSTELQHSSELYFPEWIYDRLEQREEHASHATLSEEEKAIQRKMIVVSLWCIQTYPSSRPSMNRVLEMIEGPLESLSIPPRATTVYI